MDRKEYKNIREKAGKLRVAPSGRVWNRLENRLDQDRGKVKISTIRKWIAIAAGLLVLVFVSFWFGVPEEKQKQVVLMELDPLPAASFASYQYASQVNAIYEQDSWRQISEGTKARLRSKNDQSPPPVLSQEDSL